MDGPARGGIALASAGGELAAPAAAVPDSRALRTSFAPACVWRAQASCVISEGAAWRGGGAAWSVLVAPIGLLLAVGPDHDHGRRRRGQLLGALEQFEHFENVCRTCFLFCGHYGMRELWRRQQNVRLRSSAQQWRRETSGKPPPLRQRRARGEALRA